MNIRFDGKTAVITGGATGIGFACAELMLASGAKVIILDLPNDQLTSATNQLTANGDIRSYPLDLATPAGIAPTVSKIKNECGEIDVLIQTACQASAQPAEQITQHDWDTVYDVNTKGLFLMMQAVACQSMIPRNAGAIVNLSSVAGIRGMQEPLCAAHYSSSKGAAIQLTRQAAVEWAKYNIRTNAVAPGGVKTESIFELFPEMLTEAAKPVPLKRLSGPTDIAQAICFLASDAASMITGQILIIDGGASVVGV
ncbi:MAG: family oxidoreductase [Firmicutes bacterium]|nr:family oxidoreductase [Bacillota bacterium]